MKTNYEEILSQHQCIETNRLILRPFSLEDAQGVLDFGSDPETLKYLIWEGISTLEQAKDTILNYYLSRTGIYAIVNKQEERCIGCIDFRIDEANEKASFGYVLNRNYWSKGYMSEALGALIDLYFSELEVNRIESTHYVGNEGSGRVMEKCGMIREGLALQEVKVKGIFRDVVHYGITRDQWLARQGSISI